MKKIVLIITTIFWIVPLIVFADCIQPISGGGSSEPPAPSYGPGCGEENANTCLSTGNGFGVRFQLYEVKSKDEIYLKGYFDVLKGTLPSNTRISAPGHNTLYNKLHCTKVTSLQAARDKRESYLIPIKDVTGDGYITDEDMRGTVKKYLNGDYGKVWIDDNICCGDNSAYKKGELATWAFDYEGNTPKSGFLYTYFFTPILEGEYETAANLFGMTEDALMEMLNHPDDYYITAEVLYTHYDSIPKTPYYFMPVSESGFTHGARDVHTAIITTPNDPDAYLLIPNMIKKVNAANTLYYNWYGYSDGKQNYKATCEYAYGFEAWNIREICDECGKSCENDCKDTYPDSAERLACAKSWCAINDPDNTECVSSCRTPVPDDAGCLPGETDGKQCSDYKASRDSNSEKELDCEETDESIINNKTHLAAKVCYDDNSDFSDGNTEDLGTDDFDYGTKFYKIVCETTLDFKDLPGKQYIYLDQEQPMFIHFSYKVNYKKECTLYYKIASQLKTDKTGLWTLDYSKSRIKYDIDALDNAYEETETKMNDSETTAEEKLIYQAVLTNITTTKNKLESIYKNAITRLENLSRSEAPEIVKENDLELVLFDYSTYTEYRPTGPEFVLVPYICEPIDKEELGTRLICLFNNYEEVQYITYKEDSYECRGEGGQYVYDSVHNKGTYTETVYYTLPDSYIGAHSDNIGPYHTISDCEDAVSSSNGFCKIVEYTYVLPPFDGVNPTGYASEVAKVGDKLTLKFEAGECNEFGFTYKCDYEFEDKYCEACKGIDKTSEEYKKCLYEKCGCEAYCGSDAACRFLYCPKPCEGCDWGKELEDDECQKCDDSCKSLKNGDVKKYTDCIYDECCYKPCNGNIACEERCCISKCNYLYSGNASERQKCIEEECPSPPPGGTNYIFRTVSLHNPFPDRGTETGVIGKNWYNKEKIITDADEAGRYHDSTSGFNNRYEYSIKINSKQLKQVKKMVKEEKQRIDGVEYNGTTSYKFFKKSDAYTSGKSPYAYCSKFLYEDLANIGVNVQTTEASLYCVSIN